MTWERSTVYVPMPTLGYIYLWQRCTYLLRTGACNGGTSQRRDLFWFRRALSSAFSCGSGTCATSQCDVSCGEFMSFKLSNPVCARPAMVFQTTPWMLFRLPGEPFDDELALYSYQTNGQCWNDAQSQYTTPCTTTLQCVSGKCVNSPIRRIWRRYKFRRARWQYDLADVEYDFTYRKWKWCLCLTRLRV